MAFQTIKMRDFTRWLSRAPQFGPLYLISILSYLRPNNADPRVLVLAAQSGELNSLNSTSAPTAPAQIYTPNWSGLMPWEIEIQQPPKIVSVDNRAYVVAGQDLYIHDGETNVTHIGQPLLKHREFYSATAIAEEVYICGGWYDFWEIYLTTCEVYNTQTNSWHREVRRMKIGRGHHAAVAVKHKMYVMGGQKGNNGISTSLIIYDSKRNTWFKGAPMLYEARDHAAVAIGAHLFTCGGNSEGLCSGYNIKTNRWYPMAPMTRPRSFHEMVVWNGAPLILGGLRDVDQQQRPTDMVEYYDWIHNRTLLLYTQLQTPVARFGAALLV